MLTADTITDEQIIKLGNDATLATYTPRGNTRENRDIREWCQIAMGDLPGLMEARIRKRARARCAEILNARDATP